MFVHCEVIQDGSENGRLDTVGLLNKTEQGEERRDRYSGERRPYLPFSDPDDAGYIIRPISVVWQC